MLVVTPCLPRTFAVTDDFCRHPKHPNREKYIGKNREQKLSSKTKIENQEQRLRSIEVVKWSKGPCEVTELLTVNAVAMYNNKFP